MITGNPIKTGTFNFTITATDRNLTAALPYQITVTVQGPPDQLQCSPSVNGGFPEGGTCVLPDANVGLSYQGHLPTSHGAGGALSVVAGTLPPGLALPATFGPSGAVIGGTPGQPGEEPAYSFTVQGTGDQGQPPYQTDQVTVDPNQPLTIHASGGSTLSPGTAGQAYAQDFFVRGGAAPYTLGGSRRAAPRPASPCKTAVPGRATPIMSSPGHRPPQAPSRSPCGSPTTTVSRQPINSASPSNPEPEGSWSRDWPFGRGQSRLRRQSASASERPRTRVNEAKTEPSA